MTMHCAADRRVPIAVGGLTATFSEGDLFDIRWRGTEVVQRLYVAVRDEDWNTIPATLSEVTVAQVDGAVSIEFEGVHRHGPLGYAWQGTITASADGTLTYEMRGRALSTFRYCKIGFNVHHGLRAHAGRGFRLRSLDGEHAGSFDAALEPQLVRDGTLTAMTPHFDRLDIDLAGATATFSFDGDRFEMQDHRNWCDANWKTYGTPLEHGFPMVIEEGSELYQRVALSVSGPGTVRSEDEAVDLLVQEAAEVALPRIGHLLTGAPDEAQLQRLRELCPDHLRVDLHPGGDLPGRLAAAEASALALGCALEVGAFLRIEHGAEDAEALASALAGCAVPIERILVLAEVTGFSAFRGACPPVVGDQLRPALVANGILRPRLMSGTSQFFVDINRDRPEYSTLDGIVFALNPQVHASDDRSMMQNCVAIPDIVHFARELYGEIDVVMSPVALIGSSGPYPAGPDVEGDVPANQDPRQRESFCAAWTVAALVEMAASAVTSVTLFDLVGPRGLLTDPEEAYPVADVLALLAPLRAMTALSVRVSDPDRVAGLVFRGEASDTFLIANLTSEPVTVRLPSGEPIGLAAYGVVVHPG